MSEQQKHTPGPWKVEGVYCDSRMVLDPLGYQIVEAHTTALSRPWIDAHPETHWGTDPSSHRELSDSEYEANARLIAAAPDLLEACQESLALWGEEEGGGWSKHNRKLEAAIQKATGGPNAG